MKKTGAKAKLPPHVALIILLPLILALLMLNTGWLQMIVPAVTVYGTSYSALEFSYYFYDAYYDYINEHAEELDELGLDVSKALKDQVYNGDQTWQDYFKEVALDALKEDTILLEAAGDAGFTAQEEVQMACDARIEEVTQYCIVTGLSSLSDYFTTYYGTGMTQERYLELYSAQTLAELYLESIAEDFEPEEDEMIAHASTLSTTAEPTVTLSLAYFGAENDRVTGQPEQRQWDNARILAETFLERWDQEGGGTELFCAMAAAYTRLEEGSADVVWENMSAEDLELGLAQWCFEPERSEGDTAVIQGEKGWWAVCYLDQGEDARLLQARQDLWQASYDQWRTERQAGQTITTYALGMAVAL